MHRAASAHRGAEIDMDTYYSDIQSAYDRIASDYDDTIGRALVSRRAKELAVREIARVSPPGGLLLDIGCYTGTEAVLLARRGFRVVGVDLSPKMIELARGKARRLRLGDRTRFEIAKASDLSSLRDSGVGSFDTAYSVYGTLNLEPRIGSFKSSVARLLKPRGSLVIGLLNPTVWYELLLGPFVLHFNGYRKLARKSVNARIGSGGTTVPGFLYTPGEFDALLRPEFSLERVLGVHIIYPPPKPRPGGREGLWWMARIMDRLEERLEARVPFSNLGWFSLLVFGRSR
jgi:ubiquinone/menaquinone biosynthesis C-methylase UbiE